MQFECSVYWDITHEVNPDSPSNIINGVLFLDCEKLNELKRLKQFCYDGIVVAISNWLNEPSISNLNDPSISIR